MITNNQKKSVEKQLSELKTAAMRVIIRHSDAEVVHVNNISSTLHWNRVGVAVVRDELRIPQFAAEAVCRSLAEDKLLSLTHSHRKMQLQLK